VRYEDFRSAIESHTSNDVLESGLDSFQLDLPRQDRRTYAATYRGFGLAPQVPSLSVTAYFQRRNRDFSQTLGIREPGFAGPGSLLEVDLAIETVYEQDTAGLLTSVEWRPFRAHRLVAGFDLVRDTMDSNVTDTTTTTLTFPRLPRPLVDVATESPANETRQDSAGVFLQDEWAFAPRLKLVLGARYNTFESSLLSTTDENLDEGSSRNGKLSAAASLLFEPSRHSSLRASYSQGYRNPSLLELYEGTAHGGGGLLYPNPDLAPETSDNLEAGARLATARLSIDASVFHTRARDYVTTRLCGGDAPCPPGAIPGTDRVYDNVNGARTRGLELSAAWRLDSIPLELFGEATYLHREFEHASFTTTDTGLPRLWGRGGLRVGRTGSRQSRFFGELWVRAASETDEELAPGQLEHYPGWTTLSARGGVELGSKVPVGLTLEVGNILDEAYRPAQESLYQPGRHVLAKIVTRF
jgi:hemoglobin/transferrin/lactoferrin receptor protein